MHKSQSKRVFSVGVCGVSYFLNQSKSGQLKRYTLCKVNLSEKIHWKVAVNKEILLKLQHMSRKRALSYCQHLMSCRKQISMGDRGGNDKIYK